MYWQKNDRHIKAKPGKEQKVNIIQQEAGILLVLQLLLLLNVVLLSVILK